MRTAYRMKGAMRTVQWFVFSVVTDQLILSDLSDLRDNRCACWPLLTTTRAFGVTMLFDSAHHTIFLLLISALLVAPCTHAVGETSVHVVFGNHLVSAPVTLHNHSMVQQLEGLTCFLQHITTLSCVCRT